MANKNDDLAELPGPQRGNNIYALRLTNLAWFSRDEIKPIWAHKYEGANRHRQPMADQPSPDKVARTTRSRTSNPRHHRSPSPPPPPHLVVVGGDDSAEPEQLPAASPLRREGILAARPLSSPQFRWWLVRFLITSSAGCSLFPCSGLCGCWSLRGR